ncbi:MAG: hypothetical protein JNL79_15650 [Myxococcales bacterium]|nr:hypothetical protein [Myxococcales bacterium]
MGRGTNKREARRGWQQWSEDEARAALAELSRSGLSEAAFARRGGYSTQRLRYWKARLSAPESTRTTTAMSFVAVPLPMASRTSSMARHIEIDCDGIVLRVREEADVEQVARLTVALVRARRC